MLMLNWAVEFTTCSSPVCMTKDLFFFLISVLISDSLRLSLLLFLSFNLSSFVYLAFPLFSYSIIFFSDSRSISLFQWLCLSCPSFALSQFFVCLFIFYFPFLYVSLYGPFALSLSHSFFHSNFSLYECIAFCSTTPVQFRHFVNAWKERKIKQKYFDRM